MAQEKKILFLPGWAESLGIWKESCLDDFKDYEKIFMNLGGHFPSEFPKNKKHIKLEEFLQSHFGIINNFAGNDKLTLVGHSTGSLVLLNFINRFPEKVDKIILVGSFLEGPLNGTANWTGTLKDWNLSFLIDLAFSYSQTSKTIFQNYAFGVNPEIRNEFNCREEVRKYLPTFFEEYKRMDPKSLRIVLEILNESRLVDMNLRKGLSINFIHGARDPVVPYSQIKKFCNQNPTARLFTMKDSGHSPQWEEPIEFWNTIKFILET